MDSISFLFILVALLYAKWMLFVLLWVASFFRLPKTGYPKAIWARLLSAPYNLINRFCFQGGVEKFLSYHIGLLPSNHLRKLLFVGMGVRVGKEVSIHYKTEIRGAQGLILGDGTIIGDNCILDARRGLVFGKNVSLSSNVSIYTLQHDHRDPYYRCPDETHHMTVKIGDRVWLGANVIVLPGVTIGEGAVCCAGCVVTKDVPSYAVVAGIPARKVGDRPQVLKYEFKSKNCCRLY